MSNIKVRCNFDDKSKVHDEVISVYVEMGDKVFYFENSLDEEYFDTWEKGSEEA